MRSIPPPPRRETAFGQGFGRRPLPYETMRDTGPLRESYTCSATCHCGHRMDAACLSGLRDSIALHAIDCPGGGYGRGR